MNLNSFSGLKTIFENAQTHVQTGMRNGNVFALKHFKNTVSFQVAHERLERERFISERVYETDIHTFVHEGENVLVKPFFAGVTLANFIKEWSYNEEQFLKIAISITEVLDKLHSTNVIHLDLNPSNIIYNPVDESVNIIDFGSSSLFKHKSTYLGNPDKVECDLHYISPEQTGRINRVVDLSSDLYSLGVIFFELSTGDKPFKAEDPLELIHNHIAKTPPRPSFLNSSISITLEKIIFKLLAKDSEDRYQSCKGLIYDLKLALGQLESENEIKDFPLATQDRNDTFRVSQKLYGRSYEIEILFDALRKIENGDLLTILLSGDSGTGKSSLVAELHKKMTKSNALFVEGKFDQVNRNLPYSAWVSAFNNFIEIVVTESDDEIKRWKEKLTFYLNDRLPYIAQMVTNLHWLFPDLSEAQLEINAETQKRLRFAIKSFLEVIATEDHPLIIFLDDWQWADKASIDMLQSLSSDKDLSHLLLIAAYRGNEITDSHNFKNTELSLHQANKTIPIEITNLSKKDTLELLKDTLTTKDDKLKDLNELIYARTEGNAFFYIQFLNTLNKENVLKFNHKEGNWEWDLQDLNSASIPENLVDLMVDKIEQLTDSEKEVLKLASCIGSGFDLGLLQKILNTPQHELEGTLSQSLVNGLILSVGYPNILQRKNDYKIAEFRFAHDKIQQGIYETLTDDEKSHNHYLIGKNLLDRYKGNELIQNVFSIVEQLNKGRSEIRDDNGRVELAKLNYKAGEKSKIIADFESSLKYTNEGIKLLKSGDNNGNTEILIPLLLQRYELSYLLDYRNEFDGYEKDILSEKLSPYQEARYNRIKINGLVAKGKVAEALTTGLDFLDSKGYHFKRKPTKLDIIVAAIKTSRKYNKNRIQDLIDLPVIEDPFIIELFEIIQLANGAAYFTNQQLWVLMNIQTTAWHIDMGLCPMAGLTFNAYGAILIISRNDTDSGIAFGNLSQAIFKKLGTQRHLNKTLFGLYALINWWEHHASTAIDGINEALNLSLASGDFVFVSHCCNILSGYYVSCGNNLDECLHNTKHIAKLVELAKDYTNVNAVNINEQYFLALRNPEHYDKYFNYDSDKAYLDKIRPEVDDADILFYNYYATKLRLNYLLENYDRAQIFIDKMIKLEHISYGTYISIHTDFFMCANMIKVFAKTSRKSGKELNGTIKIYLKKFRIAARKAPVNFGNKYHLLQGDYDLANGKLESALNHGLKALDLSIRNNFKVEEAMAWSLCSEVYKEQGMEELAKTYNKSRHKAFLEYGALTITRLIEKNNPWIKQQLNSTREKTAYSSGYHGDALGSIDLKTIFKSSAILSAETDYQKLSSKLVEIAVQNAAAERGFLVMKSDDDVLRVKAYGDVDGNSEVIENDNYKNYKGISQKVLSFVEKSKQVLIIPDAMDDEKFNQEEYIRENEIRSIFALPIMKKSLLIGILYLENNRTSDAFTSDRVELLKLLTGQISISFENAMLFESMEEKVRERTLQFQEERDNSEKLLLNILPKSTAVELKETGEAKPKFYKEVSVLFLDFKNFSGASKQLNYSELINQLDEYFKAFDTIIEKYHIEKIKTIGDAYMCACGLPIERNDHALLICKAAIEMQKKVLSYKEEKLKENKPFFEARIGIHSGSVIAGVVGSKKFAYDIWGDTVNVASRIETGCSVGNISISEQTYQLVKDKLACEASGKIEAKHMGLLETYELKF